MCCLQAITTVEQPIEDAHLLCLFMLCLCSPCIAICYCLFVLCILLLDSLMYVFIEDAHVAQAVYLRQRKVSPQLVAQMLSHEAGFPEATLLRNARVMRLCVHPAVQKRGLGSRLLAETLRELAASGGDRAPDTVGACFGATPPLLRLWRRAGAELVWLGHGAEPSSGHHSAMQLAPVTERARDLVRRSQARFALQLPGFLRGPLAHVDARTLAEVLASLPPPEGGELCGQDGADVRSYAWGARSLDCCRHALVQAALEALRSPEVDLDSRSEQVLMDLLQGRPAVDSVLRRAVRCLPWAQPPMLGRDKST